MGLRPKKRLGQNFLMDAGAAARIAALAMEDRPSGTRVLEIGAGTGRLTAALLAAGGAVTAIEIDPELVSILRSQPAFSDVEIAQSDALLYDFSAFGRGEAWVAAGNLPYNIATPLLMGLIEMQAGPDRIVAMIQKDVAARMVAKPSTPAYGSLSVAVQYAMHVERAFTLGPGSFYPRPNVDSTVVRLTRRAVPAVAVKSERRFMQVVRAAFAYRRKTLANSVGLALAIPRDSVTRVLHLLEIDTEIRGEQLAIADFARIADAL